jgi:hypothetical protein
MLRRMNNLFATWHHRAAVDLGDGSEFDVAGLLARAEARLAGLPELTGARRLVTAALADVSAWAAARTETRTAASAPGGEQAPAAGAPARV